MKTAFKSLILTLSAVAVLGAAGVASADTPFQANHPRREQVNNRLANQSHRITRERREGEITRTQAHVLRAQDRRIRAQERLDASRHGGHITKGEQRRLNHEENGVSREIGH
jgi:hypothetical protein